MKKIIVTISLLITFALVFSACDDTRKDGAKDTTSTTNSTPANKDEVASAKKGETTCGEKYLDSSKNWTVTFTTNQGDFTVTLDPKNSPIGSAHLAALVNDGFYDNLTFHRVIKGFVIQGGDPNGDGSGSSDCSVISEAPTAQYVKGDFAWAKTGDAPNGSAGSQFFIVTDDSAANALTNQYGTAGKVTDGISVVEKIENSATNPSDAPVSKVTISKATLNES
jgi:peptidyl-prolyl cis-trans isomerase B (cyclophilin B)